MLKLTQRQREILEWMTAYIQSNWRPPTVVEIGDHFGIKGASAYNIMQALVKKGYVEKGDHSARSMRPVDLALVSEACIDMRLRRAMQASEAIAGVSGFSGSFHAGRRLGFGGLLFTVTVRGCYLADAGILDGDVVVVRKQETVASGDLALISVGFEAMLRRLVYVDAGFVRLMVTGAEDEAYGEARVEEVVVYGKAIAVYREDPGRHGNAMGRDIPGRRRKAR